MLPTEADSPLDIYTVSRLNRETRLLLYGHFASVWVEGELTNLAQPASGHWYFTLKDADAQVRCAMFRPQTRMVGFSPHNGEHVLVRAQVGLYEPRGDYQLVVEFMEPAGFGALQQAFETLKRKLAVEGLFDVNHKRPLPRLPQRIGVITSPTGAALRDILTVLKRRFPTIPVVVYPARVQGADAPEDLCRALTAAVQRAECDVLILARGGGSLEDLWAFNDETLARAIHACPIPVVSGVGHEIDFTITDLVADFRAPTPSAAAEAVSPDRAEWQARLARDVARLSALWTTRLRHERFRLDSGQRRLALQHPVRRVQESCMRLDALEVRMTRALTLAIHQRADQLAAHSARLQRQHPALRLSAQRDEVARLHERMVLAVRRGRERCLARLSLVCRALDAVSPLATLERGYSITRRLDDSQVLREPGQVAEGEWLESHLSGGILTSVVTRIPRS